MTTAKEFHDSAKQALAQRDPVRALDLLDQPWMLGLPLTKAEARENLALEDRARDLDKALHGEAM
jgi:hypothetical protein